MRDSRSRLVLPLQRRQPLKPRGRNFPQRYGRVLPHAEPLTTTNTPVLIDDGDETLDGQTFTFVPVTFPAPTEVVTNSVVPSHNWSGYVGNGSGLIYRTSYEKWTEPHYANSSVRRDVSIWAGLGSGSSAAHTLAQAGVHATTTSSGVTRKWWWEVSPGLSQQPVAGFPITGG